MFASEKYQQDYFKGLDIAVKEAARVGVKIEYQRFLFNKDALSLFEEADKISKWSPDVVIGPRSSNRFLALKDHFKDVMVLSPLATANAVSDLPDNFYSLSFPNELATLAMVKIVLRDFPSQNIVKITEADCKNCVDYATTFEKLLRDHKSKVTVSEAKLLGSEVDKVDLNTLLKDYHPGDIFLMPNTSSVSGVLMGRISNHLKTNNLVFLGGDEWGSWKAGYVGKLRSPYTYRGLRISPWAMEAATPEIKRFKGLFAKYFPAEEPDTISYISFYTMNTVLDRMANGSKKLPPKGRILESFKKARSKNKNIYRPKTFSIFELTQDGESLSSSISISNEVSK
jgi:hypothetical protein